MKKSSRAGREPAAGLAAVGIDLGDRWSHWCELSERGEVVRRGRVRSSTEAMAAQAAEWRGVRVAIENGAHSGWVSRVLEAAGCQVHVANPPRWRGTAHNAKNDANDAESLARVARVDPQMLYPITHHSEEKQHDLAVVRVRASSVIVARGESSITRRGGHLLDE